MKQTANNSGRNAETIIRCVMQVLENKGYPVKYQYRFNSNELKEPPIFSNFLIADFLVRGISPFETGIVVSSKRQESVGTSKEKLHYHVVHVIKKCLPLPSILVLVGEQWAKKEKLFCQTQVDGKKLIDVFFSYERLLKWAETIPSITDKQRLESISDLPLIQLSFMDNK